MNHLIGNNPVPPPTRDIAEPYEVQTARDTTAFTDLDDGDPIRNKTVQRPKRYKSSGLNDPLELFK